MNKRILGMDLTPKNLAYLVPAASLVVAVLVFAALPDSVPEWARGGADSGGVVVRDPAVPAGDGSSDAAVPDDSESPLRVAIVGDSFMVSALPGFRTVFEEEGVGLVEAAFAACPVGREPLANLDGTPHFKASECVASTDEAYSWIMDNPTDLVVWHDLQSVLPRFGEAGAVLEPGSETWTQDLLDEWSSVLDDFLSRGMEVVILVPPLRSQDADCASAESEKRCTDIRAQDATIREATEAFEAAVGSRPGVRFLMLDDLLCPGGVPCPATVDGITVREGGTDQTHFTEPGAEWFARRIFPLITAQTDS